MKEVLRRLKDAGLTINPQKCAMAQQEVQYLGYCIGGGAIKPQVGKVSAILETPVPTTKRQVRSFLGVVGWYRRFVLQFSTRAGPLTSHFVLETDHRALQWLDTLETG